jgi:Ca2+-dependent lipid-binding protein
LFHRCKPIKDQGEVGLQAMSLLNVIVNRAQIADVNTGVSTAATQQYYVVFKLQNVKSTTFTAKGPQPCWNQEFLFEIDNFDTGLLIEVWDKGMLWDKTIGYFWEPLQKILQCAELITYNNPI